MWLLQSEGAGEIASLLQYGVLGVILVSMVLGLLWAKPAVDALQRELEAARDLAKTLDEIRRLLSENNRLLNDIMREIRNK